MNQHKGIKRVSVVKELKTMGKIRLWDWRNFDRH